MTHAYYYHRFVYWISGENLRDKDGNGTVHSQFFRPIKNGILKTDSVSADKKTSKTEVSWLFVPMLLKTASQLYIHVLVTGPLYFMKAVLLITLT